MNIYLISQSERRPDTYDSAIVIAESEPAAIRMHPADGFSNDPMYYKSPDDWAPSLDDVNVQMIGEASPNSTQQVLCASFNWSQYGQR
jgi:hypothetical protein